MSRNQHLLIRRLGTILRLRMTTAGHLAQVIDHEHRGSCPPVFAGKGGCTPACREAQALVALTEPYMPKDEPAPRPQVVIGRIPRLVPATRRVRKRQPAQIPLLEVV